MTGTRASWIKTTLAALWLCGVAQPASAAIISFSPNPAFGTVGGSVLVDLVWTAQGDYIGGFDVDLTYDASVAEVVGVAAFDPAGGLGSALFDEGLYCAGCSDGGGTYSVQGLSSEAPADLMSLQDALGNSFVLATLEFVGVANGATDVGLGYTDIINELGARVRPFSVVNGRICISSSGDRCPAEVPEPGPLGLLLLGFGLLRLRRPAPSG